MTMKRNIMKRISLGRISVALLGACGVTIGGQAADGRLSVEATPNVLHLGQEARVDVLAHFPPTAYAFAASDFDVFATAPAWQSASAGAIIGTDVLGVSVGQAHAPHLGILADPANPIRVWAGQFAPVSAAPAFVQVQAVPGAFAYYPSKLTSTAVPCNADPGEEWIFLNPLYLGRTAAVPGAGTTLSVGVEGFQGSAEDDSASMFLLAPANPRGGATTALRVRTDANARTLGVEAKLPNRWNPEWDFPGVRYAKEEPASWGYECHADFPIGTPYRVRLGGETTLGDIVVVKQLEPALSVDRLPDIVTTTVEPVTSDPQRSRITALTVTFDAAFRGGVNVMMSDGSVRFVRDSISLTVYVPVSSATIRVHYSTGYGNRIALRSDGTQSLQVTPLDQ
jgi:hypothetical protein